MSNGNDLQEQAKSITKDVLIIGIVGVQAMVAAMVNSSPEDLGLTKIILNWITIGNVGLVVLMNRLETFGK